jgi:hypothetical protein
MYKLISFLILCCFVTNTQAQTLTGAWYGRADVLAQGNNSNYLTELILRQKGNDVEGVFGYYFRDTYQSFYIRGTYDPKTREVFIKNLPMLFYKATGRDGIECPMNFSGKFIVSQVSSSLTGSFYSDDKYKYTCPEIRVNFSVDNEIKNQDSLLRNTLVGRKIWKPAEEDYIVSEREYKSAQPVVQKVSSTFERKELGELQAKTINIDTEKLLVKKFESRKKSVVREIEIASDSIRVSFYDNGEIDGDSISVFLNNQPVLVREGLTARALTLYLALDPNREINEISMFAENLGLYPPNTALMIISDGENAYEVYLSSSLDLNSTVRLRRKKK